MPAWIHDRAAHILAKNPSMPKSEAFAIATQQGHATGKTPKGYGTSKGKSESKQKYDSPKSYKKTPNPGNLKTPKLPARTKRAHVNAIQFSAFGQELKSILKQAGIPLNILANPKFAPFFDRVAAGGASAPKLFKGGPAVHIPGISPARQAVQRTAQAGSQPLQAAQQLTKSGGLKELLLKEIPGTKPWIVGPSQTAMRGLSGAGKVQKAVSKTIAPIAVNKPRGLPGQMGKTWDVSRQTTEMGV